MWKLYQMAMASGLVMAAPYLIARRGRHYLSTVSGRLVSRRHHRQDGPVTQGALWLHAVSVGEVGVAHTLARSLPEDLPLLVTTVTPTGQELARKLFASPRATVAYLPFDLGFAIQRFFDQYTPSALILIEGDYWPLVLRQATQLRIPIAVANGRISQRSFPRLARLRRLSPRLCQTFFEPVLRFAMQTDDDRQRLIELGVPEGRIAISGNLKYDTEAPELAADLEAQIRQMADERPILVAGSTMAGEDERLLDALAAAGGGERLFLVLAPRHPERWDSVADLLAARQLNTVRRSRDKVPRENASSPKDSGSRTDILLLDSLGELAAVYKMADIAFIGGTLVPTGGHNPLEPARFGVPITVGPSMHNFKQIAEDFTRAGAWHQARDTDDLARTLETWLHHPQTRQAIGRRAAELVASGRGAVGRTLDFLAPVVDAARQHSASSVGRS